MAKKRKQKEEEKEIPAFVPPKFDEKEYMTNEIKNSKIAIFVFLYSALFAVISWLLTIYGEWYLAVLLGLVALVTLANLMGKLRFDLSHVGKKEWIGNYFMFFLAWIGIWIILCNPPFYDFAHPDLEELTIGARFDDGEWHMDRANLTHFLSYTDKTRESRWITVVAPKASLQTGHTFNITMRITDNVGVSSVEAWIITPAGNDTLNMNHWGNSRWSVNISYDSPGEYRIEIYARDVNGNSKLFSRDANGNTFSFFINTSNE